jgi:hypothetical protein
MRRQERLEDQSRNFYPESKRHVKSNSAVKLSHPNYSEMRHDYTLKDTHPRPADYQTHNVVDDPPESAHYLAPKAFMFADDRRNKQQEVSIDLLTEQS